MIKNFILTALRNLWKEGSTSMINIFGLAIALSISLLIFLYIRFQYSYDNFHERGDRIYRIAYHLKKPIGSWNSAETGNNVANLLKSSFSEIESIARFAYVGPLTVSHGNQTYVEEKTIFADPEALRIFSFPIKEGNAETVLQEKNAIIISSKIAAKYFGNENPIGKYLDDNLQLKVMGVMDVPDNSHIRFDILGSYDNIRDVFPHFKKRENDLIEGNVYTYILLDKKANASELEVKFPQFVANHIPKDTYDEVGLFLEPLTGINLNSDCEAYLGEVSLTKFTKIIIVLFIFLGTVVLSIASFNFVNIAVAHISGRIKEVGVRKVFGAKKKEIFIQFVLEYWIYSLIAVLISVVIVQFSLPYINNLLGRKIIVNYFHYFLGAFALLMVITLFTGLYPSLIASWFNPTRALKGVLKGSSGSNLKSFLIATQFTISLILVLATFYVYKQISYYTTMDMGVTTKNVLVIPLTQQNVRQNYETIKAELLKQSGVISVVASSNIPAVSNTSEMSVQIDDGEVVTYRYISIDDGFVSSMGIKVLEGEGFSANLNTNQESRFLVNKTALKELGIEGAIGRDLQLYKNHEGHLEPIGNGKVIGVIEDYAYRPTYDLSRGVVFGYNPDRFMAMFVQIQPGNEKETLAKIESVWQELLPGVTYNASFLEDHIKNDFGINLFRKVRNFIMLAAIPSFIIALLGLFGMSMFNSRRRIREIGIRRVNGANIKSVLLQVNKNFIILILVSVFISFPVVFFVLEEIRKNPGNMTTLSFYDYMIAFMVLLAVSLSTISWQSWKAAAKNPVEALRYE